MILLLLPVPVSMRSCLFVSVTFDNMIIKTSVSGLLTMILSRICWHEGSVEASVYQPLGGYFEAPERAGFHRPLFEKHQCQRSRTKPFDQVNDQDASIH